MEKRSFSKGNPDSLYKRGGMVLQEYKPQAWHPSGTDHPPYRHLDLVPSSKNPTIWTWHQMSIMVVSHVFFLFFFFCLFFYGDKALVFGTCPCVDCNVKVLDGLEGQVRWYPTFWLCVEDVIQECFLTGFVGWLPWCPHYPPPPPTRKHALLAFLGSEPGSQTRHQMKASRANVIGESVPCFLLSQSFGVWESRGHCQSQGRQMENNGQTDRAQSTVATCHGLTDIFWVQRNFSSVLVFNNHSGGLFITSLGMSSQLCWE